jgi:ribonuclease HII
MLPGTPGDPAGRDAGWEHERRAWEAGYRRVAGLDEAGRGALAGPVVAAAVVFGEAVEITSLRDSKALSARQRERLEEEIRDSAVAWGVGSVAPAEVDRLNVLQATLLAMRLALEEIDSPADLLLLDAVRLPGIDTPQRRLVGGDRVCASIAAASILAKVARDRQMVEFDRTYPYYGFGENKGYGTPAHLDALERRGPSPIHRFTFRRVRRPKDPESPLLV